MPSDAIPAAKVTACCSAIPTSKQRFGNFSPNKLRPVPDGIAAVIATMRSSASASVVSVLAKNDWEDGTVDFDLTCAPVTTSNLATLCHLSSACSADR